MGRASRDKGKKGEVEVKNMLQQVVDHVAHGFGVEPVVIKRDTTQSDGGGYDLTGIPWLAPEVKRVERLAVERWWKQACAQAKDGQCPVLLWRRSREEWRVRVRDTRGTRDMTIRDFLNWFERNLIAWYIDKLQT